MNRPPPRPVPPVPPRPWLANESPHLDAAAQEVARAIHAVDEAVAIIRAEVNALHWLGPDADAFRQSARTECSRLDVLRQRLVELNRALRGSAAAEAARYRQQAMR